jgi:hypothetical protein
MLQGGVILPLQAPCVLKQGIDLPARKICSLIWVQVDYPSDINEEFSKETARLFLVNFAARNAFGESYSSCCVGSASPDREERALHEVNRAILSEFNRAGIVFSVPQRDIYLHQPTHQSESQ